MTCNYANTTVRLPKECVIGREDEFGQLKKYLQDPQKPIILIEGVRGVGKTTLARSVIADTNKRNEVYVNIEKLADLKTFKEDPLFATALHIILKTNIKLFKKNSQIYTISRRLKKHKKEITHEGGLSGIIPHLKSILGISSEEEQVSEMRLETISISNVIPSIQPRAIVFFDEIQYLGPHLPRFARQLRSGLQDPGSVKKVPRIILSGSVATAIKRFEMATIKDPFYLGAFKTITLKPLSPKDSAELLMKCMREKFKKIDIPKKLLEKRLKSVTRDMGGIPRAIISYCMSLDDPGDIFEDNTHFKDVLVTAAIEELQHITMFVISKTRWEREQRRERKQQKASSDSENREYKSRINPENLSIRIADAYNFIGLKSEKRHSFTKDNVMRSTKPRLPEDITENLLSVLEGQKILNRVGNNYIIPDSNPIYIEATKSIKEALTKEMIEDLKTWV